MSTTITALPLAAGIDAAADWFAMDDTSGGVTQRINRNTMLGITGSPVGTTDTQALTNKTLGNTNTVTLKDTLFTLQDNSDTTKQVQWELSGITTATTRTLTVPNASLTLVGTATTQTLTNKTLTSPTINGGSIDNATVTVDAIAGHTAAGNGTVYGLSIHSGVLQTANSVTSTVMAANSIATASIQDSAVTTAKINDAAVTPAKRSGGYFIGTFTLSATGNLVITGVGFTPKMVEFFFRPASSATTATMGRGVMTTLSQYATWAGSNEDPSSARNSYTDACFAVGSATSATETTKASYVSMDSDGFTVNVSAFTAIAWTYIAYG